MKLHIIIICMIALSCGADNSEDKVLELKEKELELKEEELKSRESKLYFKEKNSKSRKKNDPFNSHPRSDIEKMVLQIRKEFNRINDIPLTTKVVYFSKNEKHCIDQRTVRYFFEDNKIVKITDMGSFADENWYSENYFHNGRLFFVYEIWESGPTIGHINKNEYRHYVDNDEIIKYIKNKTTLKPEKGNTVIVFGNKLFNSYTARIFPSVLCE